MHFFKRLTSVCVIWCVIVGTVYAVDWHTLAQPRGEVLNVYDDVSWVNAELAKPPYNCTKPPFDTGTDVTEIRTDRQEQFVRLYNPTDPQYPSNQVGSWIMRASEVRGLTPAQLRDRFALPAVPTKITIVLVPSGAKEDGTPTGTYLWTGIAGLVDEWGNGGGLQTRLMGSYIPSSSFKNGQDLGLLALAFFPSSGGGNAGAVATYLDNIIPAAYSDLEDVYNVLDLMNYGDKAPLQQALVYTSPLSYDVLTRVETENSALFHSVIAEHANKDKGTAVYSNGMWIQALESERKQTTDSAYTSYSAQTKALCIGRTVLQKSSSSVGVCAGFFRTDLAGNAQLSTHALDEYQLGVYGDCARRGMYARSAVTGGYHTADVQRSIIFSTINRTAHSETQSYDIAGNVHCGYIFGREKKWQCAPDAGIAYYYFDHLAFSERNADSLDLTVHKYEAATVRTDVGIRMSAQYDVLPRMKIVPDVYAGWTREIPMDDRAITAHVVDQRGSFTVHGFNQQTDTILVKCGLVLKGKQVDGYVRYRCEYTDRLEYVTTYTIAAGFEIRF